MAGHCARATFGAAAEAGEPIAYGTVDAAMFEEAVTAYRNNPTYLVANMPLLRALTPEQLAEAIERLDMTHYSDLHPVVIKGSAIAGLVGRARRRSRSWWYAGIACSPSRSRSPRWMRKGGFSCPRCRPTRYGGAAASSIRSTKSCSCIGTPDMTPTRRSDTMRSRAEFSRSGASSMAAGRAMPIWSKVTQGATGRIMSLSTPRPGSPATATTRSAPIRPISSTSRTFAPTGGASGQARARRHLW